MDVDNVDLMAGLARDEVSSVEASPILSPRVSLERDPEKALSRPEGHRSRSRSPESSHYSPLFEEGSVRSFRKPSPEQHYERDRRSKRAHSIADKASLKKRSKSRTKEKASVKSTSSMELLLKGFKPAQIKALKKFKFFQRPNVSLQGKIFRQQDVTSETDPVSRLVAKHQFVQPSLTMTDLDAMKRTGMTPKRLWFTETYKQYAQQTNDSLDHIIFGQPASIVGGKTVVGNLSWDKIIATMLVDKKKWPGFTVPNLATNLRRAQEDSVIAVSSTKNVSKTVLGIMSRLVAEFIIATQETRRLTAILPHFTEFLPPEHRDMFEGVQFDLLRISKACAESTERFVLLQECCAQTDNAAVVTRLKDLRTKWRSRMKEFPLVDTLDDRDSSACRFRTDMAPAPTHVTAKKFTGMVKVCRPSVQKVWKWGTFVTPTTSTSASSANTPPTIANKTPDKKCSQCGSRKHLKDNCPQISANAKRMNASRGRGKGRRGRGRGRGTKRKLADR